KDSDRTESCLSGIVVESTIMHPFEFDFYLTSHSSSIGTSHSTHYHILYDENQLTSDSLQTLSYNLCYTFTQSTHAVSIITPVYYAYLACNRARFHSRGKSWSNIDSETDRSVSTYSIVKPKLQKVMNFI
ncbi:2785_t:CDS:1, partial [Funneliformis geosporum]